MLIRSRLVSQPNNKLISHSEQLFNTTDLSPITFTVVLPPKLHGKISQILKIIWELWMRIGILKYVLSKYY